MTLASDPKCHVSLKSFFDEQKLLIPNVDLLPAYKVLELAIKAGVASGVWKAGDALPPERNVAEACGLSVGTVKRTMLNLTHEGVLYRRQGSGTFVSGTSFSRENRRYYLFLDDFGGRECPNAVTLHSVSRIPAIPAVNAALRLAMNEDLYEVTRSFSEEGPPVLITYSYLSARMFPDLESIPVHRFEQVPFFIMVEEDYEISTLRNEELFGVARISAREAAYLHVPEETPALLIKTLAYSQQDTPFEYRLSYCLTDQKFIYRAMR